MDYVAFAEIVPLRIKLTKKHVIDELLTWFIASTEIFNIMSLNKKILPHIFRIKKFFIAQTIHCILLRPHIKGYHFL
ncbi:hypothetical protein D3F94_21140 [Escherichia coli]|nr:hypothetical protein [Escherichia coli]